MITRLINTLLAIALSIIPLIDNNGSPLDFIKCQGIGSVTKKLTKNATKKTAKKSIKQVVKNSVKSSASELTEQTAKKTVKKFSSKEMSKEVLAKMTKEQQELFTKKGYRQVKANFNGKEKPLLISKDFDPNLKIPREYTGDWDPVAYHKGDPRYVLDGCETNLGRMKRGKAPLYKDPANTKPEWHGYSEFEVHHGGQKADPDYFALMGKEHKSDSKILHTNPREKGSEINRPDFDKHEREPMYKMLADQLSAELFPNSAIIK